MSAFPTHPLQEIPLSNAAPCRNPLDRCQRYTPLGCQRKRTPGHAHLRLQKEQNNMLFVHSNSFKGRFMNSSQTAWGMIIQFIKLLLPLTTVRHKDVQIIFYWCNLTPWFVHSVNYIPNNCVKSTFVERKHRQIINDSILKYGWRVLPSQRKALYWASNTAGLLQMWFQSVSPSWSRLIHLLLPEVHNPENSSLWPIILFTG